MGFSQQVQNTFNPSLYLSPITKVRFWYISVPYCIIINSWGEEKHIKHSLRNSKTRKIYVKTISELSTPNKSNIINQVKQS